MARPEAPRRLTFNKNADFVVRRAFKAAGRLYAVGQPFKFANTSLTERQVRMLYSDGHLVEASGVATVHGEGPRTGESAAPATTTAESQQERLSDLSKLSLKELQAMAKNREIPVKMTKAAQIKALTE